MDELQRVGEVIEASTTDFVAQCYELYQSPPLGSLVKTRDLGVELYGIVYNATTTSFEPGRRPIARGKDEYHYLPPKPARIHGFVYLCPPEEVKEFSQSFDFLNILLNTRLPVATDELVAACLRQMSQVYEDRRTFLVAAGKELAILLSGNFNQLKAILERIKT